MSNWVVAQRCSIHVVRGRRNSNDAGLVDAHLATCSLRADGTVACDAMPGGMLFPEEVF